MTKEQADEMIALLKRIAELQEAMAADLSYFMQAYRENNSFARSVVITGDRRHG